MTKMRRVKQEGGRERGDEVERELTLARAQISMSNSHHEWHQIEGSIVLMSRQACCKGEVQSELGYKAVQTGSGITSCKSFSKLCKVSGVEQEWCFSR